MHTEGPGIWQENLKSRKMRNTHFRTWNMAKKLKKVEYLEMSTVGREIWQENWKSWKMRNIHLTTWNMRKSLKNVKNEKCTLKDLEYGEKTENHGKWEIHTLGREIWRRKLKKVENLEMSTVGRGIWQENWKSWKMRNMPLTNWKMTKSLKNVKSEKCTLKDLEYGEKLKITENEKYTL